jgi:hypothetical protein
VTPPSAARKVMHRPQTPAVPTASAVITAPPADLLRRFMAGTYDLPTPG